MIIPLKLTDLRRQRTTFRRQDDHLVITVLGPQGGWRSQVTLTPYDVGVLRTWINQGDL